MNVIQLNDASRYHHTVVEKGINNSTRKNSNMESTATRLKRQTYFSLFQY